MELDELRRQAGVALLFVSHEMPLVAQVCSRVVHLRAGRVRLVAGTLFGLAGVGGSLLGSHWNKAVDADF